MDLEETNFDPLNEESAKGVMRKIRGAREKRTEEGNRKGWVMKGHCCQCDSNVGFSRRSRQCRECGLDHKRERERSWSGSSHLEIAKTASESGGLCSWNFLSISGSRSKRFDHNIHLYIYAELLAT